MCFLCAEPIALAVVSSLAMIRSASPTTVGMYLRRMPTSNFGEHLARVNRDRVLFAYLSDFASIGVVIFYASKLAVF